MKRFKVTGGMGRLAQYPKTVEVTAKDKQDAHWKAMTPIRNLITEQDFNGDDTEPFLSKVVSTTEIIEITE